MCHPPRLACPQNVNSQLICQQQIGLLRPGIYIAIKCAHYSDQQTRPPCCCNCCLLFCLLLGAARAAGGDGCKKPRHRPHCCLLLQQTLALQGQSRLSFAAAKHINCYCLSSVHFIQPSPQGQPRPASFRFVGCILTRSGEILRSAAHLIIVLNRQGAQLNENGKGAIHCGQKELLSLLLVGDIVVVVEPVVKV